MRALLWMLYLVVVGLLLALVLHLLLTMPARPVVDNSACDQDQMNKHLQGEIHALQTQVWILKAQNGEYPNQ